MASHLLTVGLSLVLAWGALAFGAVYPWAYWPLLGACAVLGVAGLLSRGRTRSGWPWLAAGLALVALAVIPQLIPLDRATLVRVSPATDTFLQQYLFGYREVAAQAAAASDTAGESVPVVRHPISVDPRATQVSLTFVITLGIFLLGGSQLVTRLGAERLARIVLMLGVVMALVGIIQKATVTGKALGFWVPTYGGSPFGPFVNRNHFAGWMIMALPLALGYLAAQVAHGMRGVKSGFRNRLLWFSSPDANKLILVGVVILVMGISLVLTLSRSGITSFTAALVLMGWVVARRQATTSRRAVAGTYVIFVFILTIGWVGLDQVCKRFTAASWSTVGNRAGAWADSVHIMRDFPVIGSGLNTYGTAMLVYQTPDGQPGAFVQAHNDYLQLAAEGGILLGVPILLTVGLFVREVWRRFREARDDETTYWIRVGAVTGLLTMAAQEVVEFSLQMPGNAVLFTVLAAIAIHMPRTASRRKNTPTSRQTRPCSQAQGFAPRP